MSMRTFTKFIGACCNCGQPKIGTHVAPKIINNYLDTVFDMDMIEDFNTSGRGYRSLYALHNHYLHLQNKVITIGGDHSISLATVASSAEKYKDDLTVVWVDAHPDLNTRESSLTQNIHGMPVASILGLDNLFDMPTIKPHQLIYIGIRDIDPYEQKIIHELDIENYTMEYINKYGLTDILTSIRNIDSPIHLSFDVDSIDPKYFASTGTPVENGLKLNDIYNIIERLKGHIVSADIVEFNPYLSNNITKQREAMYIANYINCLL